MEKHGLRVFRNRLLRKMLDREAVGPSIMRTFMVYTLRCILFGRYDGEGCDAMDAACDTCWGKRNTYRVLYGVLKARGRLGDLDADGIVVLK
jgi:hypothetical protein